MARAFLALLEASLQDTLNQRLIEAKKITKQQVVDAERLSKSAGTSLAASLVKSGVLTQDELHDLLA